MVKKQKKNQKSKLFRKPKKTKFSGLRNTKASPGKFSQKEGKKEKTPRLAIRFNLKKVLSKDIRLGSKVPEALDKVIEKVLKEAAERTKKNGRTTILPQDL